MNEIEWLVSLDKGTRGSRAGLQSRAVDVTEGVMAELRARSAARDDDRVFMIGAAVAAVVGALAIALVAPVWFAPAEPFAEFGDAINLVLR